MPKFSELRELLQFRSPTLDPVTRRLEGALSIDELRRIASQKTPRAVFHYVDGGSDAETTVERNRKAFADLVFVPEALNSVADPDLTTELIGKRISLPLVFAPTGYTRMMHHEGEIAVSRVAARNGFPYALSTVGTSTVEDIRRSGW
jgi:L-lactate dehydrogenase (cytochrome)